MIQLTMTRANTDCIENYDVSLDRPYTVREFIDEICKKRPDERGSVSLCWWHFSETTTLYQRCEYASGTLTGTPFPDVLLDKHIIEAKSYGGYGRMNYTLRILYAKTKEETKLYKTKERKS